MKKFVYGVFYLAVFGLVIFGIYAKNTVVVPTCTDGIMNQNETGIDCGGSCISCAVKNLKELKGGSVSIFGLEDGRSVFLGTIVNPNEDYVASDISYEFVVFDTTGYPVERILGTDTIFPLEKRYVFSASADTNAQYIGSVKIEIASSSVKWDTFYDTLKPDVHTISGPNFSDEERSLRISGAIKNESSFSAYETKVIALLFDKYDDVLFASQWTTSDIPGFSTKDFSILIPRERNIIDHIDRGKTKILIQTQ
jgi:hypothetical protein